MVRLQLPEFTQSFNRYSYCLNNPLKYTDPTGQLFTNFLDKEGNLIQHIDDGSNAVFQLTGKNRSDEYFKFTNYDEKQGGKNEVNVQTVIDFTQDYTRERYTSKLVEKVNKEGQLVKEWETNCNRGTYLIAKSVNSALEQIGAGFNMSTFEGSNGALFASDIAKNLARSYSAVTLFEAQTAAKQGGFVVGGWSSHAFTLNKAGMINNVGAPRPNNNIWNPAYDLPKSTMFYILYLGPK